MNRELNHLKVAKSQKVFSISLYFHKNQHLVKFIYRVSYMLTGSRMVIESTVTEFNQIILYELI